MNYKVRAIYAIFIVVACAGGIPSPALGQVGRQQGLLDPNIATEKELLALPHLNATIVQGILDQRPFLRIKDLDAFLTKSLSREQVTQLYGKMFLAVNLNSATREEVLLIPGAGNRMAREFLEYRPYKTLEQFRKEIGKYVDAKELARLEQYVFVPIKLNTATDEEIMSIPGMTRRMLYEFKEYRPYKTIEQFRKEIGKYVGPKGVARYEIYITLE